MLLLAVAVLCGCVMGWMDGEKQWWEFKLATAAGQGGCCEKKDSCQLP